MDIDRMGRTKLFYMIGHHEKEEAIKEINQIDDLNYKDKNGDTYLHMAAEFGELEIATLLINKGADINCVNNRSNTPLKLAISCINAMKNSDMVKLLIANGADLDFRGDGKYSPREMILMFKHPLLLPFVEE